MAENISESLFQSIDTIVMKRLEAINFDNTDIYTITDASRAEYGEYKVTDGNVTFTAYSQTTNYREKEAVYVTIPNNDFNQQKLIIGKYVVDSDTPFVFTAPTSTMIDVTGNIIQGEIPEVGLTANAPNDGEDEQHEPYPYSTYTEQNEEEKIIWQLDCRNRNYIDFERLGIKGDFKTWLNEFNCVKGHYGFKLKLKCVNTNTTYSASTFYELLKEEINKGNNCNWDWIINSSKIVLDIKTISEENTDYLINKYAFNEYESQRVLETRPEDITAVEWGNLLRHDLTLYTLARQKVIIQKFIEKRLGELYNYYYFTLDSDDMFGDVYNFVSYHRQEQVFDISNLGQIIAIELSLYQNKDFEDIGGELIDYTDLFDHILPNNIFAIDPYIMLGYDLEGFDGEQAFLTTTDSLTYKKADAIDQVTTEQEDYDLKYNKKVLHLSWLHEDKNGKIGVVQTDSKVDGFYQVRWYRWRAGAPSPDEWAGVEWEYLTVDGEGNELGPHTFQCTLVIDDDSYNKSYEMIKAFIIYTPTSGATKVVKADPIIFNNEGQVLTAAQKDLNRGLSLKCLDGYEGDYYIYRQNYDLIDEHDSQLVRTIECNLYTDEPGNQNNGLLTEAKTIAWHIPIKNTMLKVVTGEGVTVPYVDYSNLNTVPRYDYTQDYFNLNYNDELLTSYIYSDPNNLDSQPTCKTTGFLYKEAENPINDELFIIWYGDPDKGYQINPYLCYTIEGTYSQEATNNNITCEVNRNNRDYTGVQFFSFGTAGTNGTAYTLTINIQKLNSNDEPIGEEWALTAQTSGTTKYLLTGTLRDTRTRNEVDFNNNEIGSEVTVTWDLWQDDTVIYKEIQFSEAQYLKDNNKLKVNGQYVLCYYVSNEQGTNGHYEYVNSPSNILNENTQYYIKINSKGSFFANGTDIQLLPVSQDQNVDKTKQYLYVNGELTLDNLIYVRLTVEGWGDYKLTTIYPIAIRAAKPTSGDSRTYYTGISGAKTICYPTTGYPEYYNNPYVLYKAIYDSNGNKTEDNIIENSAIWNIYSPHGTNNENENYVGSISDKYILQPADFYVIGNPQYGVQAKVGDDVVWTQPIWVYQNQYFSTTLNEWDGKELKIDEESGTIVTNGIAAGKKNPDNTFSGVMLGDWSRTDISPDISGQTGIYGFYHNSMSYGFMEDGTGFIGQSGRGRILFDGNKSTITSNGYESAIKENGVGGGVLIDLDDGYQEFINKNSIGSYVEVPVNPTTFENLIQIGLYLVDFFSVVDSNTGYDNEEIYYQERPGSNGKFDRIQVNSETEFNRLKSTLYIASPRQVSRNAYEEFISEKRRNGQLKEYILSFSESESLIRSTPTFRRLYNQIKKENKEIEEIPGSDPPRYRWIYDWGTINHEVSDLLNLNYETTIDNQIMEEVTNLGAFRALVIEEENIPDPAYDSELTYYQLMESGYSIKLNAQDDNLKYTDHALEIGTNENPNFYVQWDGSIHARNGTFEGDINGGSIQIGPNPNFIVDYTGNVFIGDGYINDNDIPTNYTVTISNEGDFWAGHNILHIDPFGVFSVADETFKIDGNYFYAGKILNNNEPTGEYTLTINNEGQFEAGRYLSGSDYNTVLTIDPDGNFSAGSGILQIDNQGNLYINDTSFWVDTEGNVSMWKMASEEGFFENLKVERLEVLNSVGSDVVFEGNVTFDQQVFGGHFVGNSIYDPDLHIYTGRAGGAISKRQQVTITSNNVDDYLGYLAYAKKRSNSIEGSGGNSIKVLGPLTKNVYNKYHNFGYTVWVYATVATPVTTYGAQAITIHKNNYATDMANVDNPNYNSIVGTLGYTGESVNNHGTVGFEMSGDYYGIALKAHGGGIITVGGGTDGNVYAATPKVGNDPKCYFQLHYNNDTARLCNSVWQLELGTSPHVTNGTNDYDLRYAYFA